MFTFDQNLFLILILFALPGILIAAPRTVRAFEDQIEKMTQQKGSTLFSKRLVVVMVAMLQMLLLVMVLTAIGNLLAPQIGLQAPFFELLVTQGPLLDEFMRQLIPTIIITIPTTIVFLLAYYVVFRPRLDADTISSTERTRNSLGFFGRIFYGGIYEELIARWGLLSLFLWIFMRMLGEESILGVILALIMSGLFFGFLHIPSAIAGGASATKMFFVAVIGLNLWMSLIFGYLLITYGLLAAMLSHMLLHILWYPFERQKAKHG